jgi:hypothetical protein
VVQNFVKPIDPENHLTQLFLNSKNQGDFQNGKFKKPKEPGQFNLELAPKIETNNFHQKMKTTQHWSTLY